jgi:hypothetical protein
VQQTVLALKDAALLQLSNERVNRAVELGPEGAEVCIVNGSIRLAVNLQARA